jgi:hypothetical protein
VHGREQSGQTKNVVSVQVGYENMFDGTQGNIKMAEA